MKRLTNAIPIPSFRRERRRAATATMASSATFFLILVAGCLSDSDPVAGDSDAIDASQPASADGAGPGQGATIDAPSTTAMDQAAPADGLSPSEDAAPQDGSEPNPPRMDAGISSPNTAAEPIEGVTLVQGCLTMPLNGLHVDVACTTPKDPAAPSQFCKTEAEIFCTAAEVPGDPDKLYDVTLRFRGAIEAMNYQDQEQRKLIVPPENEPFFIMGGEKRGGAGNNNLYRVDIADPEAFYHLNAVVFEDKKYMGAEFNDFVLRIDYVKTLRIRGGATVRLRSIDTNTKIMRNRFAANVGDGKEPARFPELPPPYDEFDGQFVLVNVVDIKPAP